MAQHQANGLAVAHMLAAHTTVLAVHQPGLESHLGHRLALRQLRSFVSPFGFALVGQSPAGAHGFLNRLRLLSSGVSWGGYESLAIEMPQAFGRAKLRLIHLHCGLETTADLVADVQQALP